MKSYFVQRPAAVVALIIIFAGSIEWLSGRPPICPCGSVQFWAGAVQGPESGQMLADWYSLSHVVHGLLFYCGLWLIVCRWPAAWRLVVATCIEATWELIENSPVIIERYRAATMAYGYSGDSILNSMSDIGWMIVGFLIAAKLPPKVSAAFGVSLELIALAAIRDNLTLNVLMLAHPVEAIRVWQAG